MIGILDFFGISNNYNSSNNQYAKGGSITMSDIDRLMQEINKAGGGEFSLGGAYGYQELWAKDKDGGSHRVEVGSKKDIYNALIKNRYNKKFNPNYAEKHEDGGFVEAEQDIDREWHEDGGEIFDEQFNSIYKKYRGKNYFSTDESISNKLKEWEYFKEKGDAAAMSVTKEDIVNSIEENSKARSYVNTYLKLKNAIAINDKKYLQSHLRYDQPFSIEIFEALTGKSLPKTNSKIKEFIESQTFEVKDSAVTPTNFAKGGFVEAEQDIDREWHESYADGGAIGSGKNGYIAMYKGKKVEVYADTKYEAQQKAAQYFKAKKSYEVDVYLAELNGEQYVTPTNFAKGGEVPKRYFYAISSKEFKGWDEHPQESFVGTWKQMVDKAIALAKENKTEVRVSNSEGYKNQGYYFHWQTYLEKGGSIAYKKDWEVIGIDMRGKKFKKTITLGRMSDENDVKQKLRGSGDVGNIREVTSITLVKTY